MFLVMKHPQRQKFTVEMILNANQILSNLKVLKNNPRLFIRCASETFENYE